MSTNDKYKAKATKMCGVACRCSKCGTMYRGAFELEAEGEESTHVHIIRTERAVGKEDGDKTEAEAKATESVDQFAENVMKMINGRTSAAFDKTAANGLQHLGSHRCSVCGNTFEWSKTGMRFVEEQHRYDRGCLVTVISVIAPIIVYFLTCVFLGAAHSMPVDLKNKIFLCVLLVLIAAVVGGLWTGVRGMRRARKASKAHAAEAGNSLGELKGTDMMPLVYDGRDPEGFRAEYPNDERAELLLGLTGVGRVTCETRFVMGSD